MQFECFALATFVFLDLVLFTSLFFSLLCKQMSSVWYGMFAFACFFFTEILMHTHLLLVSFVSNSWCFLFGSFHFYRKIWFNWIFSRTSPRMNRAYLFSVQYTWRICNASYCICLCSVRRWSFLRVNFHSDKTSCVPKKKMNNNNKRRLK